jgi:hypothetical protein
VTADYKMLLLSGPLRFYHLGGAFSEDALVAGAIMAIYCYNKIYGPGFAGNFAMRFVEHRLERAWLRSWVVAALVGL